ncbi:MAG TPA: triple tyrosine motif-containing protein, partial [Bacteroidia bacterium]|nr:triple tyrosine motif-containing protein [Bacteroidia bacterium]
MLNTQIIKLVVFSVIFHLFYMVSNGQQNNFVKIDKIKLDNYNTNWGELKVAGVVKYDQLDEDGVPENLVIYQQLKLFTIKFSQRDGSEGAFRYKLLGLDNTWSPISPKNEVSYYNLLPGKYTFIIQLYGNGKLIEQKQFKFELNETFDKTFVAYFIYLVIYTIIISILFSFRNGHLKKSKRILEQTVKERTAEILLQKEEIHLQKLIVEEKHREISDSINYAKRIQSALLTSQEYWDSISPENFVIWRPKDVVSGDFHWAYQLNIGSKHLMTSQEVAVWCAADCTGHGVPGAFMSMLGMSFLNEIVIENV